MWGWKEIDNIFKSALERPAGAEREAFLDAACRGDERLRGEVESLLAHDGAEGFLRERASREAAPLLARREDITGRPLGPYKIIECLGAGGMGEVYKAYDPKLGRHVALKLLPTAYTTDPQRLRRFEQEARLASSLNHPHIITIYDIGSEAGVNFIATELVEGETLRDLLAAGPLTLRVAVEITAQVAEALEVAHEARIVHRDIKPENVMLRRRDRIVKVLDFGLSKLTEGRTAAPDTEAETRPLIHTETGVALGTVAYMSPEQLRGAGVDARSDVWSLGVVLHEMVTGRRPFQAPAHADLASSILRDDPAPLPPETPPRLRAIVARALSKEKAERYGNVSEMLAELRGLLRDIDDERAAPARALASRGATGPGAVARRRWALPAALVLAAVVAAAAYFAYQYYWSPAGRIDSLAVLPFLNVGGSPDTEYLSDGITDSLISSLSQLPNVKVMSRNSVFRFKGPNTDALAAARQLNVRAVLTGRVRQHGDAFSMSVELVDARDNSILWDTVYNRSLSDIITVQEEIAKEISEKLRLRLSGEEQKLLTKRYTEDTEAYQLYLKCTFFWNKFTPEAERTAIDYCTQAIVKDPNFVMPYIGLVYSYQITANNGWARPHDVYPKANAAVAKALELDPNNYLVQDAMANNLMFYDWDWAASERGFRRTIEIEPNYWHSHELFSYLLSLLGRHEEAFAEIRRAQEIDPLSLIAHVSASNTFYRARQYDRSIEEARKTLELNPGFPLAHRSLARSYAQQGKYEEAIAAGKQMSNSMGHTSQALGELGHIYAMSGKRAEALKLLDELKQMSASRYVSPLDVAFIHIGLGDKEQAFAYLEQAYQERSTWLMFIKVDPRFDPLRSDPRFAELLRRMKLA